MKKLLLLSIALLIGNSQYLYGVSQQQLTTKMHEASRFLKHKDIDITLPEYFNSIKETIRLLKENQRAGDARTLQIQLLNTEKQYLAKRNSDRPKNVEKNTQDAPPKDAFSVYKKLMRQLNDEIINLEAELKKISPEAYKKEISEPRTAEYYKKEAKRHLETLQYTANILEQNTKLGDIKDNKKYDEFVEKKKKLRDEEDKIRNNIEANQERLNSELLKLWSDQVVRLQRDVNNFLEEISQAKEQPGKKAEPPTATSLSQLNRAKESMPQDLNELVGKLDKIDKWLETNPDNQIEKERNKIRDNWLAMEVENEKIQQTFAANGKEAVDNTLNSIATFSHINRETSKALNTLLEKISTSEKGKEKTGTISEELKTQLNIAKQSIETKYSRVEDELNKISIWLATHTNAEIKTNYEQLQEKLRALSGDRNTIVKTQTNDKAKIENALRGEAAIAPQLLKLLGEAEALSAKTNIPAPTREEQEARYSEAFKTLRSNLEKEFGKLHTNFNDIAIDNITPADYLYWRKFGGIAITTLKTPLYYLSVIDTNGNPITSTQTETFKAKYQNLIDGSYNAKLDSIANNFLNEVKDIKLNDRDFAPQELIILMASPKLRGTYIDKTKTIRNTIKDIIYDTDVARGKEVDKATTNMETKYDKALKDLKKELADAKQNVIDAPAGDAKTAAQGLVDELQNKLKNLESYSTIKRALEKEDINK